MQILFSNGDLMLESVAVTLRGLGPLLNGAPLEQAHVQVLRQEAHSIVLRYPAAILQDGAFHIEIIQDNETHLRMRYWLENLPGDIVLNSFGVHFDSLANVRAYLRNGYFSWDGSEYVKTTEARAITGYAMTQLLPHDGSGSVVIGFDRHDRFQQTFSFDPSDGQLGLTILTWWDQKTRAPGAPCESEELHIFEHAEVEGALREWARLVAAASPLPPRHSARITGWCSWYNLYAYITEENILEHLRGVAEIVQREQLPMGVFQIDDGFTPELGDWLEVKPQFPRGMKPVLDEIRAAGLIPGLWIAPFMVGNRSRLFRAHPDWVVLDRATGEPLVYYRFYAEFRWHKRSEEYYILDMTHPEAFAYLRSVFGTWRREWGCEYFKIDFTHLASDFGPERAVWHTPGWTRIEVWRRAVEMIRTEIGDALCLGCAPLWASVGLVDGVRIGRDVGVSWTGEHAAQSLLRDLPSRNFGNGILWQADPDCILLRERFHELSDAEVESLALFAGLSGGVLMTSDALDELSPNRLRLWKFLLTQPPVLCSFPWLGQGDDAVLVQTRQADGTATVLILNTGDTAVERSYALRTLGLLSPAYALDWKQGVTSQEPSEELKVRLEGHESALLILKRELGVRNVEAGRNAT